MGDWHQAEKHAQRAQEHFESGRFDRAETELRRALALNPDQPEWQFNLGLTLEARGAYGDAVAAFERSFELDSNDPKAALMVGANLLRVDRPADALTWLELVERLDRTLVDGYLHRIEAYARLGQLEQAEVMFYLAQQQKPGYAPSYACMGVALSQAGHYPRAIWCLREAIKLDPELPGVLPSLADAYAQTGRMERARQLYLKELRADPGSLQTLLDLGRLLIDMKRHGEAAEKLARILEIEPHHAEARYWLGVLALHENDPARAVEQFLQLSRLRAEGDSADGADVEDAPRRLAQALLLRAQRGDLAMAQTQLLEEARRAEAERDAWPVASLFDLASLLLDAKLPAEASEVLRILCDREAANLPAMHLRSVSLFEAGRRDEGRMYARRVLALRPGFAPALHNLALSCLQDGLWRRAKYWARLARMHDPDDVALRRLRLLMIGHWCRLRWKNVKRRLWLS